MSQILYDVPDEEILPPGHLGCGGCGAALSMRLALKALGRKTILVVPACCSSVIDGPAPFSAAGVPVMHTPFASAAAAASGVRAALDVKRDTDTTVCVWAGDGRTFDIGIQALSAAAERNEDFIYVCCDNEAYMSSGVQRGPAMPSGVWTTTPTARAKQQQRDILSILAAHRIPYAATATVAYPDDLVAKFVRARDTRGTRFLHVLSPCPPEWKIPSERAIEFARLAVAARMFPLVEIIGGRRWRVTVDPPAEPLEKYLEGQGRFRGLVNDAGRIAALRAALDERWADITSGP